jgi:hypothetical protein
MEVTAELCAPAALVQGKRPRYPLVTRLGGRQTLFRCRGIEEKISLCQESYLIVQSINYCYTVRENNIKMDVKQVVKLSIEFDRG